MPKLSEKDTRIADGIKLREYFGALPYSKSVIIKREMSQQLGINTRTFDKWIVGESPVRRSNKILINQMSGKKVFTI